jgi:phytoene synthase
VTTALTAPAPDTAALCRQTIQHHSKSFALASKVLPPASRDTAAVVYTWCRRVDDAIDEVPPAEQPAALARLEAELDEIYSARTPTDPVLAAFQAVVRDHRIPRHYPAELIAGMRMDAEGASYPTVDRLLLYCYRVASTVGLMMSHVMGVRDPAAMKRAAHLGIAMQLTNICRDVAEDWDRNRLYLPDELLASHGLPDLGSRLGGPLPADSRARLAGAVDELLSMADRFYRSGDRGLAALPWRCAFAVRTARLVYSRIGAVLRARDCDVLSGRAYVPGWRKALLLLRSAATSLVELPARLFRRNHYLIPETTTEFPYGVFPV